MIDIAGFGHADDRVDQQVRLRFFRGTEGKFLMGAVQRIAGLESDNPAPAHLAEEGAQLVGGVAQGPVVVVNGVAGYR